MEQNQDLTLALLTSKLGACSLYPPMWPPPQALGSRSYIQVARPWTDRELVSGQVTLIFVDLWVGSTPKYLALAPEMTFERRWAGEGIQER